MTKMISVYVSLLLLYDPYMSFKINIRGVQVACDTPTEVREILAEFADESVPNGPELGGVENGFAAVLAKLTKSQRFFLELLANSEEITDAQAREALGLGNNNKALAGVRAAIHKRFKNSGVPHPVQMEKRFRGGVRSYCYSLSDQDSATLKTIFAN
jgi:hypothetical protein